MPTWTELRKAGLGLGLCISGSEMLGLECSIFFLKKLLR